MQRRLASAWALVGSVAVASIGLGAAPPASAATAMSYTYDVTRCMVLSGIATGAELRATGTVTFYRTSGSLHGIPGYTFTNIKVNSPTLRLSTKNNSCARSAAGKTVSKAIITQAFYSTQCALNLNIGFGFPWAISTTPTYSCGLVQQAYKSTEYSNSNFFLQSNSGAPVYWKSGYTAATSASSRGNPCIGISLSATVYPTSSTSDSVTWGDNELLTVC